MLAPRSQTPRLLRLVTIIFAIYAFCWIKGWPRHYDDEELHRTERHDSQLPLGPHHVDSKGLVIGVITTATDAYSKVAPRLVHLEQEDRDGLLLFSDIQTDLGGGWPVFDVLWRYPQHVIAETKELGRYRAQVDYTLKNIPIQRLVKADPLDEKRILATMSKYKILQAMAAAWEYRPERLWYAFVDDETYVNRANMLDWLSQYDPTAHHFFGNPPANKVPDVFAAGGSSIVVSQRVMQQLFRDRKDLIAVWQERIADHSSAFDLVFSMVQTELKATLQGVWPGISGFSPTTVPFSPSLWCESVLMMHHVSPEMASELARFERDRRDNHQSNFPLRFSDMWDHFMVPHNLNFTRPDWDNLSSEPSNSRWNIPFEGYGEGTEQQRAKKGEDSAEACEASCDQSTYCMQWSYSSIPQKNWNDNPATKCHLSSSIRFGQHTPPEVVNFEGEQVQSTWKSGWKKARFSKWATQHRCRAQNE